MKTTQNTSWMPFIAIGAIISSLLFVNASCKKNISWTKMGHFTYVNKTNHIVAFSDGFEKFNPAF